jgi:Protein of unknown function (DUF559)
MPADDADDLDWLLFRQENVISRRQAMWFMSESRLRHNVSSGRWSLPHRGVYVAHNGALTAGQRTWVCALAAGNGQAAPLAGATAATSYGMRGYDTSLVHVYVPAQMHPRSVPRYAIVHRSQLPRVDLSRGFPPRTTPARSVIDAARWAASDDQARAILTAAFQQRLVDYHAMMAALSRFDGLHRRCLITMTIHDAGAGTESISEHDFLVLCRRGRLPTPTRQSAMTDAAGRRRYRDAHFEEFSLHVEIDGGQHTEAREWWADMQRQNAMSVNGDRVLRFPAWALRHDPDRVIEQVRAALIAGGWRP